MPVGKVFDASQNQVLFNPVSNFYKGKAIRAGLAAQEQDAELTDLKIDIAKDELANAPSAREAAKEKAMLDAERIRAQIDDLYERGERDRLVHSDKVMKPLFQAYGDEEDEDRALEIFNTGLPEAISMLPEEEQAKFIEMAGPDRVYDHEEIMRAGLARRYVEDKEKAENPFAKINPKDYTPESIAEFQKTGDFSSLERAVDSSPAKLTDRDKKIRDYQDTLGLNEDSAIKLADGLFSVKPNPVNGTVQLIDEVGRFVQEIDVDRPEVPRPSPKEGQTLWDLSTYATGPINTTAAAISIPLAWVGITPAEKIISARQVFNTTNQDFIRALSNNPRYPVGERKAITEEISMMPGFLDDPKLMRERMNGLRGSLEVRAAQAERDAADPSIPAKSRGDAKRAAADIRNYLAVLGEPKAPEWAIQHLEANPGTIDEFIDHWGYDPRESD